jgi:hypothetical protein
MGVVTPGGFRRCENCRYFEKARDFWQARNYTNCALKDREINRMDLCSDYKLGVEMTFLEMLADRKRLKQA